MPGQPYIAQIKDPSTQRALQAIWNVLNSVEARLTALEQAALTRTTTIDAGGQRVVRVGTPTERTDAVTLEYLRSYVNAVSETRPGGLTDTIDTTTTPTITVSNGLVTGVS